MDPGHEPRQAQRRALADYPDRLAIHKHFDASRIRLEHQRAELRWRRRTGLHVRGHERKQHVGVETAAVRCWILLSTGGFAHVAVHIFGEFIGGDDSIARFIRRAFHPLHHVIGKDTVAAAPVFAFKRALAVAARS